MRPAARTFAAALALCQALLFAASACRADETYYSRQFDFYIPFKTDPGERRIRELQLYASEDQGRNWQPAGAAKPGAGRFRFTAKRDGWLWFTVRTVDFEDRGYPATLDQATPRMKVCVDTAPPVVVLRPVQSGNGSAAVEWEVREDNLDPESMRLEYRLAGSPEWQPLALQKGPTGQRAWNPATTTPLEVRLQVKDLAGNPGEAVTPLTPGGTGRPAGSLPTDPAAGVAAGSGVRMVNSKRISINYEIKEVGKSGIATVELWYTRSDGRTWQRAAPARRRRPANLGRGRSDEAGGAPAERGRRQGVGAGQPDHHLPGQRQEPGAAAGYFLLFGQA